MSFEEAIGVDTPRVYSVVNQDDVIEEVGDLGGSVEIEENSDVGSDVEKFEEAIGVPVAVGNYEEELPVGAEDKVEEGLVGGKPTDEAAVQEVINEESVAEKVVSDEMNQMENDVMVSAGEHADIAAAGENGHQVDQKSDVVGEKFENGVSDIVSLEATPVHEISGNGHANKEAMQIEKELETGDAKIVQGGDPDFQQEVGSTGEILHQVGKSEEVKETLGLLDTGHQDYKSRENEDAVAFEIQIDKVEEVRDSLVNLDAEPKDDQSMELKVEVSASPVLSHHSDKNEELEDTAKLGLGKQDDGCELNGTSATTDSDHHGISLKPEDKLHTSVEGREVTPEVDKFPISEDSVVVTDENVQASGSNLGAKKIEGYKLQHVDKVVEASNAVAKEPENKVAKDEVKQISQGNREREIKPAADVSVASRKPANSTPTPTRPAGLGHAAPLLEPASRVSQQPRMNGTLSQMQNQLIEDPANGEADENDETREKLQMIRVKFLRLAHRLGQTPHNVVVAQVLYRLGLAEQLRGRNGSRVAAFSFDRASAMAEQQEAAGQEPLDFSCTIMLLGKTGVGKSATINSIFDEVKFSTDAFQMGTKNVQDVVGTVQGIKVRVIDTPGLLPSRSDQRQNEKILHSVKRFIKKTPPDIVLYLDRLDMQSRDFASAPPEGPNGTATSYDVFVTQRSHVVQQAIRQAAGDMRLMNPVSLVENHCLQNKQGWSESLTKWSGLKPHLLLLSFASKILAEANKLLNMQDSPPGKAFGTRTRAPPLPFLLSSLLQSRPQLKLPEEQFGDDDTLDDDLDESSDSDNESEYDELPPFKRLTKAQLAKLTKAQKKAYFDELEYREKLFMKKQLKEEKKRRKMMKKMAAAAKDLPSDYSENVEEESGGAASVPVPMPDLALPASFDSDNPTHRYRRNKATAGLSATLLGDALTAGVKVEDKLIVNKRFRLVVSGGAMTGRGDVAYGGSLEATLRDKDHPLGRSLSTFGLSVMDWHGDLALGANMQSQIPIGRFTNLIARATAMCRVKGNNFQNGHVQPIHGCILLLII
ncbi:hypothetical protein LOK49_LG03G03769 [Camellia lanceoleosa]|uniref:Uncharacterized protein n=1 Tax=Camellia lanceoleosa TaxID=1840588 RepID=A0ACC0IFJ1_9ERIC|nr:hypothetical protein LOK49_LG03G03769 [Camellia lanceoleosa]